MKSVERNDDRRRVTISPTSSLFASFDANGRWPASSSDGTVPAEMAAFLPANATFTRAHYRLAWENDTLGGASGTPAGTLVGVTVVTDDEILRNTLIATFGRTTPNFEAGDRLTFVFVSTLEAN